MPRGISPLHSDCRPRSGRNDIVTGAGRRGTHLQIGRNDIIKSIGYVVIPGRRSGIPPQQKYKQSSTNTPNRLARGGTALKPPPFGARRGGTNHRKNSPQVTVFSQSGEVVMLRVWQAIATWQSHGREMPSAHPRQPTCPRWLTAERERTERANEGNRIPIINVTSFSPHPSCLRDASAIHLPPRGKA